MWKDNEYLFFFLLLVPCVLIEDCIALDNDLFTRGTGHKTKVYLTTTTAIYYIAGEVCSQVSSIGHWMIGMDIHKLLL